MTPETIRLSDEHDALFQKYGGTLVNSKGRNPSCGYPALMAYIRQIKEPLPLSPERAEEIELILSRRTPCIQP